MWTLSSSSFNESRNLLPDPILMSTIQPFPGLRPFRSDEDFLFFGREEQVSELLNLLQRHRFLAVVGSSGSGKSSLVRCGLMSQLHGGMMLDAGAQWKVAVMQPGGDPLARLAQSLIDADIYDDDREDLHYDIMATINRSSQGLVEAVRQAQLEQGQNLLIVVDQFEEIFRFHEAGKKGQQQAPDFIRWLLEAVNQSDVPIYVVLTMRSDFLGDCARFTGLAEAINQGEYLVPKLTRDQLRMVIEGPSRVAGGEVSRRLVQRLLNDVGEQADQLPVLQHALMRSWEASKVREGNSGVVMDLDDYESVGEMANALSNHADEVLSEVNASLESSDANAELAGRLFKTLTEKGLDNRGIRRPTSLGNLCEIVGGSRDDVVAIVEAYRAPGRTFLMPFADVELTDDVVIDISHESLMRVWKRLRHWVEEESQSVRIYKRLAETAVLWREDQAGLYRDPDLQIALTWMQTSEPNHAWAGRYDAEFDLAVEFLQASEEDRSKADRIAQQAREKELQQARELAESQERLAEEQAASARKFRKQFQMSGVIAVIALVASVIAFYQMSVAKKSEAIANEATVRAEEATRQAVDSRQKLAASYRKESFDAAEKFFQTGDLLQTLGALETGFKRDNTVREFITVAMDYLSDTQLSQILYKESLATIPKQVIRTRGIDSFAYVDDTGVLHVLAVPVGDSVPETLAAVPVNGRVSEVFVDREMIRVVEAGGSASRFDRTSGETAALVFEAEGVEDRLIPDTDDQVSMVAGKTVMASGARVGVIEHGADEDATTVFTVPGEPKITSVTLSGDGMTAFLVTESQGYFVCDLNENGEVKRNVANDSTVLFHDFLPLQNKFLTIESSGLLVLTSPDDSGLDNVFSIPATQVRKAGVSPEGTRMGILDADNRLHLYSLIDGQAEPVNAAFGNVHAEDFVFDPLGTTICVVDDENMIRTFTLDGPDHLLETFPVNASAGSLCATWILNGGGEAVNTRDEKDGFDSGLNPWLCLQFIQRSDADVFPSLCGLQVRHTSADQESDHPDWAATIPATIDSEVGLRFFQYVTALVRLRDRVLPPDDKELSAFFSWVDRKQADGAQAIDPQNADPMKFEAGSEHESMLTGNSSEKHNLYDLVVRGRLSASVLAEQMSVPVDLSPTRVAQRYHLIKHIQGSLRIPQTAEFSLVLLENMSAYPNLVEVRSQAYQDQRHIGVAVDLTSPAFIDQWDGLAHCWELKSPAVSLRTTRRWPATDNQYLIWRGGSFSDFRLEVDSVNLNGNSGIDGRTVPLTDVRDVYGANYVHPYLMKGYQADLAGSLSLNPGDFHGKVINDNFKSTNPLVLADRGQVVVVGEDLNPVALQRSQSKSTVEILTEMRDLENPVRIVAQFRGNHMSFRYGDIELNEVFDFGGDKPLGGEIAIQALGAETQLTFENIVVTPLGRDISEAEIARSESIDFSPELIARLMSARKQWYALNEFIVDHRGQQWAADLERAMNLTRRETHRLLARAMIAGDVDQVQGIVDEVDDPKLLNTIANAQVGDAGFGSHFGTPVLSGCVHGSIDCLRLLAENGVSMIGRRGISSVTPLDAACFGNQLETVRFLLEQKSDPNSGNFFGFTALHEAAKWSRPEIVKLLLDAGADVEARNSNSRSALHELANISNSARQFGETSYRDYAVSKRRLDVARLLVEAGLDPSGSGDGNASPLELAKRAGDTELAEVLSSDSTDTQ